MKIALIFPPQWDPRHPPLCHSVLANAVAKEGHQVRTWDLNLELYKSLLSEAPSYDEKLKAIISHYADHSILSDCADYANTTKALENTIAASYDPRGQNSIYWDATGEKLSSDKSIDWKCAAEKPTDLPWYNRLTSSINSVARWRPSVVGITANSDTQVISAIAMATLFRKKLPYSLILLGGQAFRARRKPLVSQSWLFNIVDAICVSHGEPTLLAVANGCPLPEVPNILWYDGKRVHEPHLMVSVNFLEDYHIDLLALKSSPYLAPKPVIPVETARGCPWGACSFCGHPGNELSFTKHYVVRPVHSVIAELSFHIKEGHRYFFFVDEAIPNARLRALTSDIALLSAMPQWICYLRIEEQHDLGTFHLLRRAGCRKVFFGLETGSNRLRKLHRKGPDAKTAIRVLQQASSAGLAIHLFLITGFPDETERDRKETEMVLRSVLPKVDVFGFTYDVFPLAAEHNTPLYEKPELFGSSGIIRQASLDLSYCFRLHGKKGGAKPKHSEAKKAIDRIVEQCLGHQLGLRHLNLSNDADHLLVLSERDTNVSGPRVVI